MPLPPNSPFSPSAYAAMGEEKRVELLFEYLEDLNERLCWVDDEMTRYGFCAHCIIMDGASFDHDCSEKRW